MDYHLASSYYSFFFLYIYIFHGFPIYTRTNKTHTFQVWWIFQKKKEMFVLTYIRVCTPMCVHIRVCNNTKRMFLVSISPLCRVFSIFWIFLYILLLPLLFFFSLFVCYFIVASFFFYFPRCVIIISLNAQLTSYSELQLFTNLVK